MGGARYARSEERRRSALLQAEEQGDLAITSPLQPVQDEKPLEEFLAVFPAWSETTDELDRLDRSLRGFASGVFHTEDVNEPCLKIVGSRLWLRILDVTEGRSVVYAMPELEELKSDRDLPQLAYSAPMENFGPNGEVEFYSPSNFRNQSNASGTAILVIGCSLTIISALGFNLRWFGATICQPGCTLC